MVPVTDSDAAICPRVYLVDLKKKKMAVGSEVKVNNDDLYLIPIHPVCVCF